MEIGFLMDPLSQLHFEKDTTFAMLLASQQRGYRNRVLFSEDIWMQDGMVWGRMHAVVVMDVAPYYELGETQEQPLVDLDLLLMRLDPPVNANYILLTYLLELAESQGLRVVNKPASLRDVNEKIFATHFLDCCPKTLITSQLDLILDFVDEVETAVIKPLHAMGGQSVFQLSLSDPNHTSIIETITKNGVEKIMVQQYVSEIMQGDKRILMIDGEPVPYALARVPKAGDFRGNLAAGATAVARELTERDRFIAERVGPVLREKELRFAGLDVIGDYLTEINVTSPTCVRELNRLCGLDIADDFFDAVLA